MPISRYPRPGQPIVPRLIHKLLQDEGVNGFDGLGSAAWRRLGKGECRRQAQRLLVQMDLLGQPFFSKFASLPLSQRDAVVPLDELQLEQRTFNCLRHARLQYVTTGPNGLTIGDLLRLRGFGVKCLLDLAASLEAPKMTTPVGKHAAHADGAPKRQQARDRMPAAESLVRKAKEDVLADVASIPGALAITPRDPRLGLQLRAAVPDAPTLGAALDTWQRGKLSAAAGEQISRLLKAVRTMARAKLDDEVLAIMAADGGPRDREVIAACLQWRTTRRPTYRAVGKQFRITGERVRQVFCRWQKWWMEEPPFAPAVDRALGLVQACSPAWAADVERQLSAAEISTEPLPLERLRDLADLLGRKAGFVIFGLGKQRSVGSHQDALCIAQIQNRARKLVSTYGLASVCQLDGPWLTSPRSPQCVVHALQSLRGFAWIDEREESFLLLPANRNRLWARVRKVLAVAPRVTLDVLWKAVQNDHRFPSAALTPEQLLGFCRRHPECRVVGKTITARNPQHPLDVLQGDERKLVALLLEHGPLSRQELNRLALQAGMGDPSFDRNLQSPAIMRISTAVYGLTGAAAPARK
jgi:hypothetical protein